MVIARLIYDPCTHKFLGYRVEDTDDVHVDVGNNPFDYASELFQRGYIFINAACYGLSNFEHLRKRVFPIFDKSSPGE